MSPQVPPAAPDDRTPRDKPQGDPWHAFGYLVSGVFVYGLLGWFLDRWWDTSFMVVVGILAGAGLGIYMTFARFNKPWSAGAATPAPDRPTGRQEKN